MGEPLFGLQRAARLSKNLLFKRMKGRFFDNLTTGSAGGFDYRKLMPPSKGSFS